MESAAFVLAVCIGLFAYGVWQLVKGWLNSGPSDDEYDQTDL